MWSEFLESLSWKASGGSQVTKHVTKTRQGIKNRGLKSPKIAPWKLKLSPDWPKRGQGGANYSRHKHFKGQIHSKSLKNCPELVPTRWKYENCDISKIIEKAMVCHWFLMFWSMENRKTYDFLGMISSLGAIFHRKFAEIMKNDSFRGFGVFVFR